MSIYLDIPFVMLEGLRTISGGSGGVDGSVFCIESESEVANLSNTQLELGHIVALLT